jgi:hypothetical protein
MASALLVAGSASAHHAVNAQFDVNRSVLLTGKLTKYELINPHSVFHFEVKESDGAAVDYEIGSGAPGVLRRAGLSAREVLKVGQTYKIVINPSRNGSKTGLMHSMLLPDGRILGLGGAQSNEAGRRLLGREN